jgi:hypothetical protein
LSALSLIFGEVEIAALGVCAYQFDLKLVTDIDALLAANEKSFRRRARHPDENALGCDARHYRREVLANSMLERDSRNALTHFPFHFTRGILFKGAIARN